MTERNDSRVLFLLEEQHDQPINIILQKVQVPSSGPYSSLLQLEDFLSECVHDEMIQHAHTHQLIMPLTYLPRADCAWLSCQKPKRLPLTSVLGILEELEEDDDSNNVDDDALTEPQVDREICFTAYRACLDSSSARDDDHATACSNSVPRNEWNRVNLTSVCSSTSISCDGSNDTNAPPPLLNVDWVDLRSWQTKNQQQQQPNNGSSSNIKGERKGGVLPTTAASCTLFLRSLLPTANQHHGASPWGQQREHNDDDHDNTNKDVVILVIHRDGDDSSYQALLDYRVSDACPSWFLHAVLYAKKSMPPAFTEFIMDDSCIPGCENSKGIIIEPPQHQAMLFIYRRLPPRERLTLRHPITNEMAMTGCLWETYYVYPTPLEEAEPAAIGNHCDTASNGETDAGEQTVTPPPPAGTTTTSTEPLRLYRQVAPPYVNARVEYPGLLEPLLLPETMAILQQECLQISHWTAWPEEQHYKATTTTGNDTNGGAPWNVFPLLYCFPANQVENKTWIEPTCAVVPRTVQLLKDHLGDTLRTALYSRLDPGAVLEAHTGWQDLANHVLRVHLPLIVPDEALGLAGLWVDGCVECHAVGRVVCFDDSKTHRAFNYSNESRIVLILDLLREPTGLPPGTAVGGHSEELDKFIEQMGTGSS